MPVDRTVCPGCRNATFEADGRLVFSRDECDICRGLGIVCPTCRGERWMRVRPRTMTPSPIEPCADCMRPKLDPKTGQQVVHPEFKRPLWELDEQREIDCIQRYRDRQASPDLVAVGVDDDVPF